MLLSMLLFLLSNSCFWRNTDHSMHKESIHALDIVEGPEPEMILSDPNTKRHFSAPYPSLSLPALLYRQWPDPPAHTVSRYLMYRISGNAG